MVGGGSEKEKETFRGEGGLAQIFDEKEKFRNWGTTIFLLQILRNMWKGGVAGHAHARK